MGTATEHTLRRILDNLSGPSIWERSGIAQVFARMMIAGTGSDLYTVPVGKTFYLTTLYLHGYNDNASKSRIEAKIYDDGDVLQMEWEMQMMPDSQDGFTLSFPQPVKMLAGWYVYAYSLHGDNYCNIGITGYTL